MSKYALFLAAAALSLAAPAAAADRAWKVGNDSYHIYLSDLDLDSPAGRAEALTRAERAAARLCGRQDLRSERAACVARTVAAAATGAGGASLRLALDERAGRTTLAKGW